MSDQAVLWSDKVQDCYQKLSSFLQIHAFNYIITTYDIQSWDKDHSSQHELAIPIIYKLF